MEEEERTLAESAANKVTGGDGTHPGVTTRGVLRVFFAALALYVLASLASRSLFYGSTEDTDDSLSLSAESQGIPANGSLVNPRNGSHPTLTTTLECAGTQSGLPVLAGADVVAYFSMTEGEPPQMATGDIRTVYKNYVFYFLNLENRRAFEANPAKYLPAYGGFCSYGISAERVWTADNLGPFGDPSKWQILSDGRLHIFRSEVPMQRFLLDSTKYILSGDARWGGWFHESEPLNTACFCDDAMCDDK